MLKLTVKPGEYLLIGDEIKLVFAGGSSNNLRILVDAPRNMNVARSATLEKHGMAAEPGNEVKRYKDREISPEAQEKIKAILNAKKPEWQSEGMPRRERAGQREISNRKG